MTEKYTLEELRKSIRKAGGKIRTKRNSSFIETTIRNADDEIIGGNVFTSHEAVKAWREKNKKILEVTEKFKGKTFDGTYRVII